jgi:hypothetical protein
MESKGARLAVLAIAIGAVVALFVVLSDGDDDGQSQDAVAQGTTTESRREGGERPERKPQPKPQIPTIALEGGQPVGGVQQLEFAAGETIRFRISSDSAAEVHLHGYDIEREIPAGKPVTLDVRAAIEGVFELENHATTAPIAEISVTP